MNSDSNGDDFAGARSSPAEAGDRPALGTFVRASLLLIVCGGVIGWAGWRVWELYHPMAAAAGELRSSDSSRRAAAVRRLSDMGVNASGDVIRTVLPILADPAAPTRAAGAEVLGTVGSYSVRSASEPEATRAAVSALTARLEDRDPQVRAKAAGAFGAIAGSAGARHRAARAGRAGRSRPTNPRRPPSTPKRRSTP